MRELFSLFVQELSHRSFVRWNRVPSKRTVGILGRVGSLGLLGEEWVKGGLRVGYWRKDGKGGLLEEGWKGWVIDHYRWCHGVVSCDRYRWCHVTVTGGVM
jgi:hypothetical protein